MAHWINKVERNCIKLDNAKILNKDEYSQPSYNAINSYRVIINSELHSTNHINMYRVMRVPRYRRVYDVVQLLKFLLLEEETNFHRDDVVLCTLPWPVFEPGLLRPQCRVLTTRQSRLLVVRSSFSVSFRFHVDISYKSLIFIFHMYINKKINIKHICGRQ